MSTVDEILALEERLRQAELGHGRRHAA